MGTERAERLFGARALSTYKHKPKRDKKAWEPLAPTLLIF